MYSTSKLVKVAELYYYRKISQKEISQRLGVSVPTVSRMLQEALENGIVSVKIVNTLQRIGEFEDELMQNFNLEGAVVIESPQGEDEDTLKKILGKEACDFMLDICQQGDNVGIGAGKTIYELIESMDRQSALNIQLMPLMGGWGFTGLDRETNKLVSTMAGILNCKYYLLPAPAFVSSKEVRDILLAEPQVKSIIDFWQHLDLAVFSIGPEVENNIISTLNNDMTDVFTLKEQGAVGDILGRIIDEQGRELNISFNEKMISIPFEMLKKVPKRIGIGGGPSKYRSIKGVLQSGIINYLITDYGTCKYLLKGGIRQ